MNLIIDHHIHKPLVHVIHTHIAVIIKSKWLNSRAKLPAALPERDIVRRHCQIPSHLHNSLSWGPAQPRSFLV